MIHTFNNFHLGDNLIHLNFARKALLNNPELKFTHYYHPRDCNINELIPLQKDLSDRLILKPLNEKPPHAIDTWRARASWWSNDFSEFYIKWFDELATKIGIQNPIKTKDDFLYDYPELTASMDGCARADVIVINSNAKSGQFKNCHESEYTTLIRRLLHNNLSVMTTKPTGLCPDSTGHCTTWIGAVSARAKVIVGASTGPSWPCFNIYNKDELHVLCLDTEDVILTKRGRNGRSIAEAIKILEQENVI